MENIEIAEEAVGKPISSWTASDLNSARKDPKVKEITESVDFSMRILKVNKDEGIFEDAFPRVVVFEHNAALNEVGAALKPFADMERKATPEDHDNIKKSFNDLLKSPNVFARAYTRLEALTLLGSDPDYRDDQAAKKDFDDVLHMAFSMNPYKCFDIVSGLMNEIIYPLREAYARQYKADLLDKESLKAVNGYERFVNKVIDEIKEAQKKKASDNTKKKGTEAK